MTTSSFPDQTGYITEFSGAPQRIISLVPSQTELLADLDLDEKVIGITKFCTHPPDWRTRKTICGGTKNYWFDVIEGLRPDLIIGNKEENYKEGIERLRESYPVWVSDITSLQDALSMITSLGIITGRQNLAAQRSQEIVDKFKNVKKYDGQTVLYLIWRQPWMAAGKNTFIDAMLTTIGLNNAIESSDRYPVLTTQEIKKLAPQYIFLSSEPFPFNKRHDDELHQISPTSKSLLIDGEMFSWYGSRLLKAVDYFNTLELG
ncbi:MAG TPA: helical backbone metal receptor [Chryseolinea sp.]|nr:helical backbone metal receptor [Chryseolinea sp.]